MNSLVIPPSPNWYEASILVCAPDNTLIYGARNEIVVINDSPPSQAADVKIIPRAHSQKIISVNINKNWGQPNKLLATASEDKTIKLWNLETMEKKLSHDGHKAHNKVIGATFAGDERVISVSEEGVIIVWNVSLCQTNLLKDIFGFKVTVTCISTCPHTSWLTAFGLKNGLVVVTDLRKQGKVLYKLRGHDKSVLSLAWCPAPVNIFPKNPHNYVGVKRTSTNENKAVNGTAEYEPTSSKVNDESTLYGNKSKLNITKKNLWANLKHADDDDLPADYKERDGTHPLLKVYDSGDDDFLKECDNLRNKILGTITDDINNGSVKAEEKQDRKVLKAKRGKNKEDVKYHKQPALVLNEDNLISSNKEEKSTANGETVEIIKKEHLSEVDDEQIESNMKKEEQVEERDVDNIVSKVKAERDGGIKTEEMELNEENGVFESAPESGSIKREEICNNIQNEKEDKVVKEETNKQFLSEIKFEDVSLKKELEEIKTEERKLTDNFSAERLDPSNNVATYKQENQQNLSGTTADINEENSIKNEEMKINEEMDINNEGEQTEYHKEKLGKVEEAENESKNIDTYRQDIQLFLSDATIETKVEDSNLDKKEGNLLAAIERANREEAFETSVCPSLNDKDDENTADEDLKTVNKLLVKFKGNQVPFEGTTSNTDINENGEERTQFHALYTKAENVANELRERRKLTEELEATISNDSGSNISEDIQEKDSNITFTNENDAISNDINESVLAESKLDNSGGKFNNGDIEESARENKREIITSVEEEPRKEFLLASSAREGNIYIWRAGTDGRMQTFLTVPNKPNHRKASKSNVDKVWIILCWVTPTMLLSTSKSGELIQWNLPKPKDKMKQFRLIHKDHSSMLFSIAAPITLLTEYDWLEERKLNAWTAGQDRLLLNTCLSSDRTNLACYPTVGIAECFAFSPLDPNRLAVGTGEAIIKIWDLSRPHTKNIIMTNFYQKVQSKVVALAWHPTNELILAYGTLEGRVGCLDTNNKSKLPTLFPHFFKSQIHRIEWGPLNGNKDELGLFVVAEGKLVKFNVNKSDREPQEVDIPENTHVYTFAWKPDYEMMLVSSKTGALIVYSTDLKILTTYYLHRKLQLILWHPDAAGGDPNVSKYCHRFAFVSNSREVVVYDFGKDTDNSEEKIVTKYDNRGSMVNCICWSPFDADMLVIAGEDGIAQVINAESGAVLSTYVNSNFEGILAVAWSPIDSDYVISAGKDHTIKIWRISDHPAINSKDISNLKKKTAKEVAVESTDLPEKTQEPPKVTKSNKYNILPNFYSPKTTSQIVADLRKLFLWKEDPKSIEPLVGDTKPEILNIFGSHADMLNIIATNETIHKERGKYSLNNTLSLFKGDIGSTIKEAIDEKRVNPWVIMMAPMVSPKLWQKACEVYAQQLSEESDADPIEVATYYLACHKIEEAIDALCEGAMFREALALAKCRLPDDDIAVTKVVEKWASYSIGVGNFENAAQCKIFLGKYEEAASVLFRRSDLEVLEFAVELAEKSGNDELHRAVLFRYNAFKAENTVEQGNGKLLSKFEAIMQKEKTVENEENSNGIKDAGNEKEQGNSEQLQNGENKDTVEEKYTEVKDKDIHKKKVGENLLDIKNGGLEKKITTNPEELDVDSTPLDGDVENPAVHTQKIRRSSSLDSLRLSVKDENNMVKSAENLLKTEDQTSRLLTTEEVKELLGSSNAKIGLLNNNPEVKPVDLIRNASENNCY